MLEQLQHRATKYILQDYSSDYKSRLTNLNLLPLMYVLEISDIICSLLRTLRILHLVLISAPMYHFLIVELDLLA